MRPVSDRPTEEVSWHERTYQDGGDPQLLDLIDVPLLAPKPSATQPENWLLDPENDWKKAGSLAPSDLHDLCDPDVPLWPGGDSSYAGLNDRVPIALAEQADCSLRLIFAEDGVEVMVFKPGEVFGNAKRRVQVRFEFAGDQYWLWLTDAIAEPAYLAQADGQYLEAPCFLTVSLAEPHSDGHCYKLIASIIPAS